MPETRGGHNCLLVGRPGRNTTCEPHGNWRAGAGLWTVPGGKFTFVAAAFFSLQPKYTSFPSYATRTGTMFCFSQHPQCPTQRLVMSTQVRTLLEQSSHPMSGLWGAAAGRRAVTALLGWLLGHTDSQGPQRIQKRRRQSCSIRAGATDMEPQGGSCTEVWRMSSGLAIDLIQPLNHNGSLMSLFSFWKRATIDLSGLRF